MDNLIQQLEALTNNVVIGLEGMNYEELVNFVEEREKLVSQILFVSATICKPSDSQKRQLKFIMTHDAIIHRRMEEFKFEAEVGMQKINNSKLQNAAYERAYQTESLFFDKKK